MCKKKKNLKTEDSNSKTEDLAKEFEELRYIHHPCICQLIAINLKEKVVSSNDKQTMKKKRMTKKKNIMNQLFQSQRKHKNEHQFHFSLNILILV